MTPLERARVERWVGTVADADEHRFDEWIELFGEPELAALQALQRRRGDLVQAPTSVGSGSDRVDHSRNLAALDDLIAQLVDAIRGNPDLDPTDEGDELLDGATEADARTRIVDTVVYAPRRG